MEQLVTDLIKILNYPLFKIGDSVFTLISLSDLLVIGIVIYILAKATQFIAKRWLLERLGVEDVGSKEAIAKLLAYIVAIIGTIYGIRIIGVNLASLAVVAGGLGIGVGFGLQGITRDFISGLILLLDRSVKVNDYVQLADNNGFKSIQGIIQNISFLFTLIKVDKGGSLVIPNNVLVTSLVLNWSYQSPQKFIEIPLKIKPYSDLVLLAETALNVAYRNPNILNEPTPKWVFKKIENSYWEFYLKVCIQDVHLEEAVISDLNYSLEYYLRQNNIQLAFPNQSFVLPSSDSSIPYQQNNSHSLKNISVKDLMREIDYFSDLNELEVRQLIEIGYHRPLNPQEILFNEGDEGDAFYIILEGQVEIFVPIINKQLVILEQGAFFGELALLLGIPRTASVKALTPTTLFAIDTIGFQKLLQRHPEMGEVIMNSLGQHQDELKKRQDQLREMGLIDDDEDDTNPVIWMRQRLERLFFKKSA